jgi:hypothetical protein
MSIRQDHIVLNVAIGGEDPRPGTGPCARLGCGHDAESHYERR